MKSCAIKVNFKPVELDRFNYGEFAIIKSQESLNNITFAHQRMYLAIMSMLTYTSPHE